MSIQKPDNPMDRCFEGSIIEVPKCPACKGLLDLFKENLDVFWCEVCQIHIPQDEVAYEIWTSIGFGYGERDKFIGTRIGGKGKNV